MRFFGSSNAAVGTLGALSSCSGSDVMAWPSLRRASLGQSPAGSDRKILPKRPSKSADRGAELSPRTPPPCPPVVFFLALITAFIMSSSQYVESKSLYHPAGRATDDAAPILPRPAKRRNGETPRPTEAGAE